MAQDTLNSLREDASGYAKVVSGRELVFPRDHGAHPEYRTEWWYLTANLSDRMGRLWGLQWTLFRQALSPDTDSGGWQSNQLWMAHSAVTTPDGHFFEQRFARGGIGQAGVQVGDSSVDASGHFNAWLDDWDWRSQGTELFPARLNFSVGDRRLSFQLEDRGQRVLHGDRGYSQKSAQGQASYYYSYPQIQIQGQVQLGTETIALQGNAWLDREWSSQPLAPNQQGWDWFSLHLNDNSKLMVYRLRHDDGAHWLSGSWLDGAGHHHRLQKSDINMSVMASRGINTGGGGIKKLPLEWEIAVPGKIKPLRIKPLYDAQWMGTGIAYWEGVVIVTDDSGEKAGTGYMELTGYE
jgi:predicted secreted hydrolase